MTACASTQSGANAKRRQRKTTSPLRERRRTTRFEAICARSRDAETGAMRESAALTEAYLARVSTCGNGLDWLAVEAVPSEPVSGKFPGNRQNTGISARSTRPCSRVLGSTRLARLDFELPGWQQAAKRTGNLCRATGSTFRIWRRNAFQAKQRRRDHNAQRRAC